MEWVPSYLLIFGSLLGMGFYLGATWAGDRERAKHEASG